MVYKILFLNRKAISSHWSYQITRRILILFNKYEISDQSHLKKIVLVIRTDFFLISTVFLYQNRHIRRLLVILADFLSISTYFLPESSNKKCAGCKYRFSFHKTDFSPESSNEKCAGCTYRFSFN